MTTTNNYEESATWWKNKRIKYNKGLIVAGFTAFAIYAILGIFLIAPHDEEFEITLFTIFFQSIGYLLMMGLANVCYNLGYMVDKHYNKDNNQAYRQRLFNFGFWFSVLLPFLVPILVIISYFIHFA